MIDLLQDAVEIQAFLDRQGWQFCFIGGIAVQRWSEARVTRDVDIALLTVVIRHREHLDWDYIERNLGPARRSQRSSRNHGSPRPPSRRPSKPLLIFPSVTVYGSRSHSLLY